jgi:hypothetical protein
MLEPSHGFHGLLPKKVIGTREINTKANGDKLYNFFCKTERFRNSPLVYAINEYNFKLDR